MSALKLLQPLFQALAPWRRHMAHLCPTGFFQDVPMEPLDAAHGPLKDYDAEQHPAKVNLCIDAYRCHSGQPHVPLCVRHAEERLAGRTLSYELQPVRGQPHFYRGAAELALGADSRALREDRVVSMQTPGATGALSLIAAFLQRFQIRSRIVALPIPSYERHLTIFGPSGLRVERYRYLDYHTCGLDCVGLLQDLEALPPRSTVLLQAVAHNPTGVDPTLEQWTQISRLCLHKRHLPVFVLAHQGVASGDFDVDAMPLRIFEQHGHHFLVAQGLGKSMSMPGECLGALHCICSEDDECQRVLATLLSLGRLRYPDPPIHGARIAGEIFHDANLRRLWESEASAMALRFIKIRTMLRMYLEYLGSPHSWEYLTNQVGMYAYLGLSMDQIECLRRDHFIFMPHNGRISLAGLNNDNVKGVAAALHAVTGDC